MFCFLFSPHGFAASFSLYQDHHIMFKRRPRFIILPGIHAMYANDGDPEVVLHMNRSSPGFDACV